MMDHSERDRIKHTIHVLADIHASAQGPPGCKDYARAYGAIVKRSADELYPVGLECGLLHDLKEMSHKMFDRAGLEFTQNWDGLPEET